jgi:16S rRNA (adenine1518-N6/adenine1519-N6)-dimethyltransferase
MKARKRFGQHFLEPAWVHKLVTALQARPDDRFVEIGPGRGAITRPLAQQVRHLLAIEVDRDLAAHLRAWDAAALTVVEGDVLEVDLAAAVSAWQGAPLDPQHPVRVVGNLPYNISSPILFQLLEVAARTQGLTDATLMLQKEVADRLVAPVGTGEYGVLTILAGLHADVTRVLSLPPGAFRPAPKVSSAVVRLTFHAPRVPVSDAALFTRVVRSIFQQRRKMLSNALQPVAEALGQSAATVLTAADIDPRRRPETLTLYDVSRIVAGLAAHR